LTYRYNKSNNFEINIACTCAFVFFVAGKPKKSLK